MNAHQISFAGSTLAAFAVLAGPVFAQGGGPPSTGAEGQTGALEEIIVEATRIQTPLEQVPAAVSVVGEDAIQLARQQLALDESLNRVPGVFMQDRYNFAQDLRVSIRGFGARSNFGIRGIKILVDGIPETLPDGQGQVDSIDLGATQQIEVIRGPSSSLYGNASGGVISVTTESGTEQPYGELRLSGGDYGFHKVQLKTGGQSGDTNYFVSLSDEALDGYREHSRAENTLLTGRLRFDLGEDRDLTAVVSYTDQPVSDDPGSVTATQAATDPRSAWLGNLVFDAGEALTQSRLGLVYGMDLGEHHRISARNYYVWRDFDNKLPFLSGGIVNLKRFFAGGGFNYTYEGPWLGKDDRLIVGFDFDNQNDDRKRFDNLAGQRGALSFDQNETVRSQGLFVQNELRLKENIRLDMGVRLDSVTFDVTDHFLSDGNDSGTRTLEDTSPMLGIVWNLSPVVNVYGTYSTAFETPTTTEFNNPSGGGGFNPDLKPQSAANLEVGVRGSVAEKYRYEMALFRIDVKDELIPFEVPSSPGRDYFVNAGKSTRNGFEASYTGHLFDRFEVTASYTYSDFKFTDFVDDAGNDFGGNALPGIPENLFFGELRYTRPSGWFAAVDVQYVGYQYADNANTVRNDAYALANLRAGFSRDSGPFTIAPFLGLNNMFDRTYNGNVRINAFGGRFFEPAPGRNLYAGVSLRRRFR
jgi:iron complex outermembrane receptor protein